MNKTINSNIYDLYGTLPDKIKEQIEVMLASLIRYQLRLALEDKIDFFWRPLINQLPEETI